MKIIENRIAMCAAMLGSFASYGGCGSGSGSTPVVGESDVGVTPDLQSPPPDMGTAPDSYAPYCGNGVRDPGEECDDGEDNSDSAPDACRTDCTAPRCGDGVTDTGEECDEGEANTDEPDACRTACEAPYCGDAIADSGEECDDGSLNSNTAPDACRLECVAAFCGDGVVDALERCDAGEENSDTVPDACRADCTAPQCGDGVADTGEQCDQGEENSDVYSDACRLECVLPSCGDSVLDSAEQCEGTAINPCVPDCGSAGIQNCLECAWSACAALDTFCTDGDPCTAGDHCEGDVCAADPVVCVSPPPAGCLPDGLTRRSFAPVGTCADGVCSYASTDTVCDDADACTSDACEGGVCTTSPVVCNDEIVCTADSCNPAFGCVFTPENASCDDENLCTDDYCNAATGCVNSPNTVACDDADACTLDDVCASASCAGEPVICNEIPASECVAGPAVRTYDAPGTCADGICNYPVSDEACTAPSNSTATCAAAECGFACNFGYVLCYDVACCALDWTATFAGGLGPRTRHTAIWSGSEMIVFGGGWASAFNTGVRYVPLLDGNPSPGGWSAIADAVSVRQSHTAVWTGSEMIAWGGQGTFNLITVGKGEAYDPVADAWTTISDVGAPSARYLHTAVWTDSEMIVWGGYGTAPTATGGRYDPVRNVWTLTSTLGAPAARYEHTAVWTGSEMIVWGGYDGSNWLNTGGRYNPGTNTWTATAVADAPSAREWHTAVWTGSDMIVWGGRFSARAGDVLDTGGRYDPVSNTWTATSTVDAPAARYNHSVVWTGSEMIVWGGSNFSSASGLFQSGGRYDPLTDLWDATSLVNAPMERLNHTAVWTDLEMIVWGGWNNGALSTGGRYVPPQ